MFPKFSGRWPLDVVVVGLISGIYLFTIIFQLWQMPSLPVELTWRPDLQLVVVALNSEPYSAESVQQGDIILEIEASPISRLSPIFIEKKSSYTLTVLRNGEQTTATLIVPDQLTPLDDERFPLTYLSLMLWVCGIFMLHLGKPRLRINALCGIVFLTLSLGIISLRLAFDGVPLTWILGHTFGFISGAGLITIALRFETTEAVTDYRVEWILYGLSILFGVIGLAEAIFLYPARSLQQIIGVSWVNLNISVFAVCLFGHYIILIGRYIVSRNLFFGRQTRTLLYFVTLSSLPIFIISVLPRQYFYGALEIQHIAFVFFSLIPLGYIYVINRVHHQIDSFFIDLAVVSTIALMLWVIYSIGHLIVFGRNANGPIGHLILLLTPFLLLVPTLNHRLRAFVERLIYGRISMSSELLEDFSSRLALLPDMNTVDAILGETKRAMRLDNIVLLLATNESWLRPAHASKHIQWVTKGITVLQDLPPDRPILRQSNDKAHPFFEAFPWAACAFQLKARNRIIGTLIMSYSANEPYFSPQRVRTSKLLTRILAVGYETIALLETSLKLHIQLQQVRDRERRLLASELHNVPLQDLTMVNGSITRYKHSKDEVYLDNALEWLNSTTTTLRRICVDLHPPELDLGLEPAIRQATNRFRRQKEEVTVYIDIQDNKTLLSNRLITSTIYHVTVEALNNIVKHSNASAMSIALVYKEGQIILTIKDNGKGNKPFKVSSAELLRNNHIGLISMHQWAQSVGGWVSIETLPTQGVQVQLAIPIDDQETNNIFNLASL